MTTLWSPTPIVLLLLLVEDLLNVMDLRFNTGDDRLLEGVHPVGRLFDLFANAALPRLANSGPCTAPR